MTDLESEAPELIVGEDISAGEALDILIQDFEECFVGIVFGGELQHADTMMVGASVNALRFIKMLTRTMNTETLPEERRALARLALTKIQAILNKCLAASPIPPSPSPYIQ